MGIKTTIYWPRVKSGSRRGKPFTRSQIQRSIVTAKSEDELLESINKQIDGEGKCLDEMTDLEVLNEYRRWRLRVDAPVQLIDVYCDGAFVSTEFAISHAGAVRFVSERTKKIALIIWTTKPHEEANDELASSS